MALLLELCLHIVSVLYTTGWIAGLLRISLMLVCLARFAAILARGSYECIRIDSERAYATGVALYLPANRNRSANRLGLFTATADSYHYHSSITMGVVSQ